jgi:hypothetical protein
MRVDNRPMGLDQDSPSEVPRLSCAYSYLTHATLPILGMITSFIIHYLSWTAVRGLGNWSELAVTQQLNVIVTPKEIFESVQLQLGSNYDVTGPSHPGESPS